VGPPEGQKLFLDVFELQLECWRVFNHCHFSQPNDSKPLSSNYFFTMILNYGTGGSFRSKTLFPISAAHTFAINKNYAQLTLSMKNFLGRTLKMVVRTY